MTCGVGLFELPSFQMKNAPAPTTTSSATTIATQITAVAAVVLRLVDRVVRGAAA